MYVLLVSHFHSENLVKSVRGAVFPSADFPFLSVTSIAIPVPWSHIGAGICHFTIGLYRFHLKFLSVHAFADESNHLFSSALASLENHAIPDIIHKASQNRVKCFPIELFLVFVSICGDFRIGLSPRVGCLDIVIWLFYN